VLTTLITPRLAIQKGDLLGSGVPYWPIELATLAAVLRDRGESPMVIDLFGSDPSRLTEHDDHHLQGEPFHDHVADDAVLNADRFVVFAISYMSHAEVLDIVRDVRAVRPAATIAVLENAQAVTGYSLRATKESLFEAGADALICGESLPSWSNVDRALDDETVSCSAVVRPGTNRLPASLVEARAAGPGFRYPVPAWDLFPIANYWSLPYAHGPKNGPYLPLLTSRGCPFGCDFCVVPETTGRLWKARPAEEVVEEIVELRDRFGVRKFAVEDLNPTVQSTRWGQICKLLLDRRAGVEFGFVAGTKAETVKVDQLPLFAAAGCRFISISPESGSPRLMHIIGKPFDHAHGLRLVAACRAAGIRTQACFLVGHPAETKEDHLASRRYLKALVGSGLDEVAVFVVAPFAGSKLYRTAQMVIDDAGALPSFSPRGRRGYRTYSRRRLELIAYFFAAKLTRGPDLWLQGIRAFLGRSETKMENLPRRAVFVTLRVLAARIESRRRSGSPDEPVRPQ
jgi:anaerobic magnesium-protoporphyrin IX monomethyl ester cyclase